MASMTVRSLCSSRHGRLPQWKQSSPFYPSQHALIIQVEQEKYNVIHYKQAKIQGNIYTPKGDWQDGLWNKVW